MKVGKLWSFYNFTTYASMLLFIYKMVLKSATFAFLSYIQKCKKERKQSNENTELNCCCLLQINHLHSLLFKTNFIA